MTTGHTFLPGKKMPHPMVHQFERLPSSVIPSHYVLKLKPDLIKCRFEGEVTVDLEVSPFVLPLASTTAIIPPDAPLVGLQTSGVIDPAP